MPSLNVQLFQFEKLEEYLSAAVSWKSLAIFFSSSLKKFASHFGGWLLGLILEVSPKQGLPCDWDCGSAHHKRAHTGAN